MSGPLTVLYVAGAARSGSTLLGNLLGQLPGWANVGEARMLWDRALQMGGACGCGRPLADCGLWRATLHAAYGEMSAGFVDQMETATSRIVRTRHLPCMLLAPCRAARYRREAEYLQRLGALYRAIAAVTGAQVVVDTSKGASYARALRAIPGLDVRVVHLIRDPRAVAYSEYRTKRQPDIGRAMGGHNPLYIGLLWLLHNVATEVLLGADARRVLRLGYREVATDPDAVVRRVGQFAGDDDASRTGLNFGDEMSIDVEPGHTVAGNPDRFARGPIRIRYDDRWRREFQRWAVVTVSGLTFPLRLRYRRVLAPRA